jgi:hypothetical protein
MKQRRRFGIDGDALATRRTIDPCRDAVIAITRIFRFNSRNIGNRRFRRAFREWRGRSKELELVFRRHRTKSKTE